MCPTKLLLEGQSGTRRTVAEQVLTCFPCHSYTQPGHKPSGVGNQDRMGIRGGEKGVVLAVSDGCSASWNSAVGASQLTTWSLAAAKRILRTYSTIPSPQQFAKLLERELLSKLRRDIEEYDDDRGARDGRLQQTFAATIIIGVITPVWTAVMGAGDGCYSFGMGKIETIKTQDEDHPPYLMYRCLSEMPAQVGKVRLEVFAVRPTDQVQCLALFSDGAKPLLSIDGGESLTRIVDEKRFVLHECSQQCRVSSSGRCLDDPRNGYFEANFKPLAQKMYDDFTVVVAQRDSSQPLPPEWEQVRNSDAPALEKASKPDTSTVGSPVPLMGKCLTKTCAKSVFRQCGEAPRKGSSTNDRDQIWDQETREALLLCVLGVLCLSWLLRLQ